MHEGKGCEDGQDVRFPEHHEISPWEIDFVLMSRHSEARARIPGRRSAFRSQNVMPLLSAFEDFVGRSLSALSSVWERLRFVGELRDEEGEYRHYGMEELFGEQEAKTAIATAHSMLYEELASTPLRELWHSASLNPSEIAGTLEFATPSKRTFRDFHGVPVEHVQLVTKTLIRVAQARDRSSRAAA